MLASITIINGLTISMNVVHVFRKHSHLRFWRYMHCDVVVKINILCNGFVYIFEFYILKDCLIIIAILVVVSYQRSAFGAFAVLSGINSCFHSFCSSP